LIDDWNRILSDIKQESMAASIKRALRKVTRGDDIPSSCDRKRNEIGSESKGCPGTRFSSQWSYLDPGGRFNKYTIKLFM
jgi:hypothetical protein